MGFRGFLPSSGFYKGSDKRFRFRVLEGLLQILEESLGSQLLSVEGFL